MPSVRSQVVFAGPWRHAPTSRSRPGRVRFAPCRTFRASRRLRGSGAHDLRSTSTIAISVTRRPRACGRCARRSRRTFANFAALPRSRNRSSSLRERRRRCTIATMMLASPGDDTAVVEDPCYALARAAFELQGLTAAPRRRRLRASTRVVSPLPHGSRSLRPRTSFRWAARFRLPGVRNCWRGRSAPTRTSWRTTTTASSPRKRAPYRRCKASIATNAGRSHAGSTSKTLAPSIRLGYLIVPAHLGSAFRAARASTSLGVSLQLQETAARFIEHGYFARHIRRMNGVYEWRRATLVNPLNFGPPPAVSARTHPDWPARRAHRRT